MTAPDRARLVIDLDALARNYAVLAADAAGAAVAPVVKADGYGLGAGPIARRLWAEGARSFFVARLAEGEALRDALDPGRPAEIHVLDGFLPGSGDRLGSADLIPVLSTLPQVQAACAYAAAHGTLRAALHVDTGMHRQGISLAEAQALADAPAALRGLDLVLLMSHLGSAGEPDDPRNARQIEAFARARALFPECRTSLAASAGVYLPGAPACDVVRPGISLYGGGPLERPDPRFAAVATLTAPVLDIRTLAPGDRLGYGAAFTAPAPMRIAIVGAGYADGVPRRAAAGGGYAWAAGSRRRLLAVTMDLLAIDVGADPVTVGELVELLGNHALLDDLAAAAGTVAHEVLVRLSLRAERIYLGAAG